MTPAVRYANVHASPQPSRHLSQPLSRPKMALQPMRMRAPTHRLAGERSAGSPTVDPTTHDRAADRAAQWALVAMQAPPPVAPEDDFGRCGWFDSSLELAAGLQVIEHLDTLPDGLPLQAA
ncbi:MAG: hypothetical protein HS128_18745 [Ideonella sp.]|nr:hypothetical protein [Ideonella sp.]MCC7456652.1 hypothetical protein [Nitrospira sp.]